MACPGPRTAGMPSATSTSFVRWLLDTASCSLPCWNRLMKPACGQAGALLRAGRVGGHACRLRGRARTRFSGTPAAGSAACHLALLLALPGDQATRPGQHRARSTFFRSSIPSWRTSAMRFPRARAVGRSSRSTTSARRSTATMLRMQFGCGGEAGLAGQGDPHARLGGPTCAAF